MAWSISTRNMQNLHSFQAAENFWNNSEPWKGRRDSWRPLDSRRMDHKRLVKRNDGSYDCVLYNTSIVRYYPDSVELGFYNTPSTNAFVWCVAPRGCRTTSANVQQFWQIQTPDGEHYYRNSDGSIKLKLVREGIWKLDSPIDVINEWVFDRKLGAQARKLIKPYATWYGMSKRLGMNLPGTSQHATKPSRYAIDLLVSNPDNYSAFLKLHESLGHPDTVLPELYKYTGARYQVPVPHDRLPRRSAI